MKSKTTQFPLFVILGLAFHGATHLAQGDVYVAPPEEFSPPVAIGLVAYFPLNGSANSTIGDFDADDKENIAFLPGGANANTGASAFFSLNSAWSRIRYDYDVELNPQSFTLAFWVKPRDTPSTSSVTLMTNTSYSPDPLPGGFSLGYRRFNGELFFLSNDANGVGDTLRGQGQTPGVWQHVAISYDHLLERKNLYVNGNLVGTRNQSMAPNRSPSRPFDIGIYEGQFGLTGGFDGQIDDVGLWNGALSIQQIRMARILGAESSGVTGSGDLVTWQGNGEPVNDLRYEIDAFTSIQDAIDAVEDGGTVHIAQGNYAEGKVVTIDKNVTIKGSGAHITIISGGDNHRVFYVDGDYDVILSGLSIIDGIAPSSIVAFGGGVFHAEGNLVIDTCVVANNYAPIGGGIASLLGRLTILNSTFYGNRGGSLSSQQYGGAGIFGGGPLFISNSTISGNSIINAGLGGAVLIGDTGEETSFVNCTITANTASIGGGIASLGLMNEVTITNSIVAGNSAAEDPDISGSVTSGGGNFIGIDTTSNGAFMDDLRFNNPASTINDVLVNILENNGGTTPTHRLSPGSLAIDAGIDGPVADHNGSPLLTDQRGASFSRSICLTTDSGAIEANPSACPAVAQYRLDEGTRYDTDQGTELDTASIKFADVIDDDGDPFNEQTEPKFKPELVQKAIDLYKDMILSHTPSWIPGFDGAGVTVTSRGPGLVEDAAGEGGADFDRHPNPFGGHTIGLTNFTEVERAIANPAVSFSITNHDAVNFGDPDTDGAAPGEGRILLDEPFPNNTGGDDNNFLITFEANLVIPATGTYYLGFQGDDGGYLRIPGQTFSNLIENVTGKSVIDEGGARIVCDIPTGNSSTVGIISLTEGSYPIQGGFFEREGGAHFEVFALEPWSNTSELITRNGATSWDANAWDLAANQTELLKAVREMMVPYIYAAKNAQAFRAKARLILSMNLETDLEAKEQEMDVNARSHLENALQAFENFARDPQFDYLLIDPVPPGFLDSENDAFNGFKEARRQLFSAYGRALATLARVDLNQLQRDYHSLYDVEVYRGSPTASPAALNALADTADAAASLLQMRLLVLGAISGLEEFPQGDFVIASSAVPRLRQLASAIRRGETVFIHDADRPSATAGHGYGSYFVPFFYEAGDTGSVFSSFGGLLSKAKDLAGLSRVADATALASIGEYAFNREAVEMRLENLMRETYAQLADLCGTIEVIDNGALTLVPDIVGIYSRYPESGQNEQGWSEGQIYQQRLAIHAAQNRYLSAATYLANVRARAQGVLDTFLKKKSLNQSFVENILTKNNDQLIGLSKQAGELEADLIQFRAKVQADLKKSQGGGAFGRFASATLGVAVGIATGNPVAAAGAALDYAGGEAAISNELAATQAIAKEESSVQRQITGLESRKLEISFETELARIDLQLQEEELLVFQQHREILREASRAEIDLESARIDILAQESALGSLMGRVNFILSELIAELSSLEDSVQNSPDTRIIRDAAIERADRKLIQAQEWAFLAARSGQYLSFGNNEQFDFFLEMEGRVLAERNSQDLEDYLQDVEDRWDLTGISNGLPRAREVRLSLKNDFAQGNYRTEDGIVYDFRAGEFSFTENNQETTIVFAGADRRSSESAFGDFLFEHRVPDPAGSQGSEMILIPFSISLQPTTPQIAGANAFGPRNRFYTANDFGVLIDGRGASDSDFGVRVNIRVKGTFSNLSEVDVILRPRGVFSIYHQSPATDRRAIRYWPFDYNAMDREAGITATINGAGGKNPQLHGLSPANDRWELVIRDQDGNNNLFFNQLDEIQDIEIIFALTSFTDSGN